VLRWGAPVGIWRSRRGALGGVHWLQHRRGNNNLWVPRSDLYSLDNGRPTVAHFGCPPSDSRDRAVSPCVRGRSHGNWHISRPLPPPHLVPLPLSSGQTTSFHHPHFHHPPPTCMHGKLIPPLVCPTAHRRGLFRAFWRRFWHMRCTEEVGRRSN